MDDFERHEVVLAFTHRGRPVQLNASAKGWAPMHLKEHPSSPRRGASRVEHEQAALKQDHVAVNSILRDWIKGQVTAIETGILLRGGVHVVHADRGRPTSDPCISEQNLLPSPQVPKIISMTR